MSINTTTSVEVEVEGVEVETQPSTDLVASTTHDITIEDQESIIEGTKQEFSVVGDGLYASINVDEAPEWLTTIIDSVVASAVASGMVNYDMLVQDVHSAIDALDVAKNTYVEQINFDASVNGIISTRLATLNATLENTYATIVDLDTAIVNADEALTQKASDITAAYTTEINSRITSVETAFADADSTIASDLTALTSAFDDQASNIAGNTAAVSGLRTYVGLDTAGSPDGTGILASISTLSNQVATLSGQSDGYIDYAFYDSFSDIVGATDEATALSIIDDAWTTEELRNSHQSDVVYFRDSANAFWYRASDNSWGIVENTEWYTVIAEASEVRASADGKISQFYAWGGSSAPADYVVDSITVEGDSFKYWLNPADDQLYHYPVDTWVLVPTIATDGTVYVSDGDIATVFDPTTRDHTIYTRHNTTWLRSGTQGIIGQSQWFVDLENEVTGPTGHVATSLSNLQTTSETYADAVGASVENKFEYSSVVGVNGTHYQTGFGLVTTATGGDGSEGNPYDSEFWINAQKFKFTNDSLSGTATPFQIDASGATPQVTFNGIVSFENTDMSSYDNSNVDVSGPIGSNNDNMAQYLGYADYAAMEAAAVGGETIISGGYMNLDLLDAGVITAANLFLGVDSLIHFDGVNQRIRVNDGTYDRVTIGNLGTGWGIDIRDASDNVILNSGGVTWDHVAGSGRPADNADVTADNAQGADWLTDAVVYSGNKISEANIGTYMSSAAITEAYIKDAQVSTLKIQDNAVTVPVSAYTASETASLSSMASGGLQIQTADINSEGQPITIMVTCSVRALEELSTRSSHCDVYLRIINTTDSEDVLAWTKVWQASSSYDSSDGATWYIDEWTMLCFSVKYSPASVGTKTIEVRAAHEEDGAAYVSCRSQVMLGVKK